MTTIFNINEFTALWFIVLALFGRKPVVLAVDPLFPPLRRRLDPLVKRAVAKGRAQWIIDLCPDQHDLWEYPPRTFLHDVFGETEDWHNAEYGLNDVDRTIPDYAMAYKHVSCNHVNPKHVNILLLGAALDKSAGEKVRVTGLPDDAVGLMRAYWGDRFDSILRPMPVPRWPINFVTTILYMIYALSWIITRARLTAPVPEKFFFAADYYEDQRDFRLYHEVAEGGPLLLVLRHPQRQTVEPYDELKPYKSCSCRDGRFGLCGALKAAVMAFRDSIRLFRQFGGSQPALYYRVGVLPFRRIVLRAFFNRYHPKFYWGRDDYNEDHILRHQELRLRRLRLPLRRGLPHRRRVLQDLELPVHERLLRLLPRKELVSLRWSAEQRSRIWRLLPSQRGRRHQEGDRAQLQYQARSRRGPRRRRRHQAWRQCIPGP